MTTVQLNASQLALDASSLGGLATRLRAAAESCESSLNGTTYMAGDDEAARVFAQGEGTDGQGYDEYAVSALKNVRLAADFVESLEAAVNNTGRVYDGVQLVGSGKDPESSGIAELRPSFGSPTASVPTSYGEGPQEPLGEFADFVLDKLREYGVPLPCADSGKLDSASSAWSSLQGGLVPIASSVRGDLGSVSGFRMPQQASIQDSRDKLGNWIDELAESADGMRDYVDQMKQNVEQAWHEIRWFLAQMAIEIIAEIAIGAVLGAISFGAGAVAMTAKILVTVGKWVLKIVDKCKDLARIMRAIGSAAARIGNRLKGLLARAVNEAAAAGVASAGASFTVNQIRLNSGSEFDANYQAQDVWGNAAASAIGGGGGAIVGGAASALRRGPNAGNLDGPDTFHGNVIGGIADGAFSTAAGAHLFGEQGNYEGAMVLGALMGGGMHFLPGGGGGGHTSTPTSGNAGSPSQTTIPTPGGSGGPAPVTTASPGGVSVPGDGAPTPGSGGGGSNTSGGGSSVDVSNDAPTPGAGDAGTGGSDSGPSVEVPAAPDSSAPETSAPETSAPETSAPETSAPETSAPETSAPETSAPETSAPETSAPETSAPETSAPATSAPETSAPETSAPEASAPGTSAPETSASETSAPETSAPETSAPETSAPETSAPETSAPETSAPEAVPAAGGTGATPASPGQDADAPATDDAAATDPEAPVTEPDDADADSTNDDADGDDVDVDAEAVAATAVGGGAAAAVLAMQLPKPPTTMPPVPGAKPGSATGGAGSQAPGSTSNDAGTGDAPGAPDAPASNTGDGSDGAADAAAPANPPTKLTLQQILDALKQINPNFDPLNPKGEYSNNCGNTSSILNDVMNGSPVTEAPTGTLTTPQMEARTGLPQTAMTPQQVIDSLVAQGPGSHCVVGVDRSTGAGHWFNAYFDGTTVWTLDAQNGTMTPFPPHEPNATNWDASIHPDHVAPVPPAVDSSAPDATAPAVDGDGSPKSGQPDATAATDATSREAGNRYVGSPTVAPGHASDGSAGAGQTYNGYDIPELTPEIRQQLDALAAQDGSPIVRNDDGSYSLAQPIDVDAFNMKNQAHDWAEFQRQVGLQQQGLNQLTIAEWQHNSDFYATNNRVAANEQAAANAALAAAGVNMSGQAVLHGPDQVAGGRADRFDGAGSFGINSSLGNQWRFRVMDLQDGVRDAAHGIDPALHPHILLNVDLGATNVRDGGQVATQATLTTAQPVTSGPSAPAAPAPARASASTPDALPTRGSADSSDPDSSTPSSEPRPWNPELGDPVLSEADHGPGWQRVPDHLATSPVDPSYGEVRAPGQSGHLADAYAHPGTVRPEIAHLITDPDAPYGRDSEGTPFTRQEWESRYTTPNGRPIYPGNHGANLGTIVEFHDVDSFIANYGDVLDRMGGPGGDFLSFPGTPFEFRSLPPSNLRDDYFSYRIDRLPAGARIEVSEIAPAFGRDGGGLQVRILNPDGSPAAVRALLADGVLAPDSSEAGAAVPSASPAVPPAPQPAPPPPVPTTMHHPGLDGLFPHLPTIETRADAIRIVNGLGRTVDAGRFLNNCHFVVNALELRFRGYDVVASPTVQGAQIDAATGNVRDTFEGRFPVSIAADWVQADGTQRDFAHLSDFQGATPMQALQDLTASWPEGGRGFVNGYWKTGGGHIFTVVKEADGVKLYDGQIDNTDVSGYLDQMYFNQRSTRDWMDITILRVDDLVPTPEVIKTSKPWTQPEYQLMLAWRDNPNMADRPQVMIDREVAGNARWRQRNNELIAERLARLQDPATSHADAVRASQEIQSLRDQNRRLSNGANRFQQSLTPPPPPAPPAPVIPPTIGVDPAGTGD